MKAILTPLIYIMFGSAITCGSFYVYSLNQLPTNQITNEFRKIKTRDGSTTIDLNSVVHDEETNTTTKDRRRIFNRNK